jgi:amino acid transporter
MILAAVVSIVVAIMAAIVVAVSRQRRTGNDRGLAHQAMEWIRPLSIYAVVLGTTATFLSFCLSPGIIRQTLTCVVYIFAVLGIALLVTSLVLLAALYPRPSWPKKLPVSK